MTCKRQFSSSKEAWIVCAFFFALLSSCNRSETGTSDQRLQATAESIQRNVVNVSCLRCHTEATAENRHVALTDITTLIVLPGQPHEHASHKRFLIKPGCPKQSFFLSIMRGGEMPPPPGAQIPAPSLLVIEEWITALNPEAGKKCESDEPQDSVPPGGDEPGGE